MLVVLEWIGKNMKIEGLHNLTGKWVQLANVHDDGESFELAQDQIEGFANGCNSHMVFWNTPVNTQHFSAFRLAE